MALSGHLRELRNRLLVCVICLTAVFTVSLYFAGDIVELLTDIGKGPTATAMSISPLRSCCWSTFRWRWWPLSASACP